ncbi:hypothetical protein BD779DRAFT_1471686 [Infundibulicybe gibba]|nr:hypothetical protein BD779DRAFT_1471686 [Infundibulicybe gibba]
MLAHTFFIIALAHAAVCTPLLRDPECLRCLGDTTNGPSRRERALPANVILPDPSNCFFLGACTWGTPNQPVSARSSTGSIAEVVKTLTEVAGELTGVVSVVVDSAEADLGTLTEVVGYTIGTTILLVYASATHARTLECFLHMHLDVASSGVEGDLSLKNCRAVS